MNTRSDARQLLAELGALDPCETFVEMDVERVQAATAALLASYAGSLTPTGPDAGPDARLDGPRVLGEFAAVHLGRTLVHLRGRDVEDILFDIVPGKVSAPGGIARGLVEGMHDFVAWRRPASR